MSRTTVIAEIGSCHDLEMKKAVGLIDAAKAAGADVAKFQFWSSADRLAQRRDAHEYVEIYRRYQLPPAWLQTLKMYCESIGLEFMATVYLPEDLETIAPLVERFKVASFEALDLDFLHAHSRWPGKQLMISIGMTAVEDVNCIVDQAFRDYGNPKWRSIDEDRVVLMHCVSSYPAPIEELNLGAIRWAYSGQHEKTTGLSIRGFSDHSEPALTWTGALAVAVGATIVEAHLRLDETDSHNPDAPHAMTQRQFTEYVRHIRLAETTLGDGIKRQMSCEAEMARYRVVDVAK